MQVDFRVPVKLWPVLFPTTNSNSTGSNTNHDSANACAEGVHAGAGPQKHLAAKLSGHLGGPQVVLAPPPPY